MTDLVHETDQGATWRRVARARLADGVAVARAIWAAHRSRTLTSGRRALPAVAGVGLISAGFASRFGVWVGLVIAGVACLILDSRMP